MGALLLFPNVFLRVEHDKTVAQFCQKSRVLTDGQVTNFSWKKTPFRSLIPTTRPHSMQPHQARSHISSAFDELHVAAEARCAELLEHLQENSLLVLDLQKSFPGTKSSKNLDWKVRWLFCGVNFQGLFGGVFFWGGGVREGFLLKRRCWREGGWRVANSSPNFFFHPIESIYQWGDAI